MNQLQCSPVRTRPYRILLAEDDLEMRRLLTWSLERSGYEVVECADGATLMRKLDRHRWLEATEPFDLVISDVRLPGYSGLDVLASVGGRDDFPPIVLISAFADAATCDRAESLGAVALLPKPFDVNDLITRVERLLPDRGVPADTIDEHPTEPEPGFPLAIEFRHTEGSAPVKGFIQYLARKLDRYQDDIHRCRVVVDALAPPESRHHWYSVKVILATRSVGTVVVERQSSPGRGEENLYLNLQMVFTAAQRQLGKKRVRRHDRETRYDHDEMEW